MLQLVLARRRGRAPRPGRAGAHRAPRRPARRVRRAAALRAHRRASARSATWSPSELGRDHPMNRLLQGEVGSGKTLVALRAMLQVVDAGGQAALLAPTEVLAQQHHRSISAMLGDLAQGGMLGGAADATTVVLLTGSMGKAARQEAMLRIVTGEAGIVIGTHALLEDRVEFADLGLVVVDEQHRFGVEQRAALTDKAGTPAARARDDGDPDPAHGRDDGLRRPRDLGARRAAGRPGARSRPTSCRSPSSPPGSSACGSGCARRSSKGHQVYVVCPRICGDAERGGRDRPGRRRRGRRRGRAQARAGRGRGGPCRARRRVRCAGLRTAILHGRLPPDEKDRTMRAFAAGDDRRPRLDDRDRGRRRRAQRHHDGAARRRPVRRLPAPPAARPGRVEAACPGCACWSRTPRSGHAARDRLDAVAATTDGFELSRVDLEQRREGDVLGASQSGFRSGLVTLRVLRDEKTIVRAREAAEALLSEDPALSQAPDLAAAVAEVERSAASAYLDKG